MVERFSAVSVAALDLQKLGEVLFFLLACLLSLHSAAPIVVFGVHLPDARLGGSRRNPASASQHLPFVEGQKRVPMVGDSASARFTSSSPAVWPVTA